MRHFLLIAWASIAVISCHAVLLHGQTTDWLPSIPPGNVQARLVSAVAGFDGPLGDSQTPTDIAFPNDRSGRRFVAMQLGNIRVIDASGNLLPTFLNTRNSNTATSPHHFTSLAFHNQFAKVSRPGYGTFYTIEVENAGTAVADFAGSLLTLPGEFQQVLYEYRMNDITASVFAGTRREVMRFDRPGSGSGHNVNDLAFGRDGYLYISNGDGGGNVISSNEQISMADNAQFLGNVLGKVLRIDPLSPELKPKSRDPVSANGKYRIPRTNPFMDDPDPTTSLDESVDEIYAYGLRNPFRITFDRQTNELYVGSVGQAHIESVYRVEAGANLGWNLKEGSFIYDRLDRDNLTVDLDNDGNGLRDFAEAHGLTDPTFEYDHEDGLAVIGGFVYRGNQIPELYGKYVFGDYAGVEGVLRGRLFYGDPLTHEIFEFQFADDSEPLPWRVYSIGEDLRGELYVTGTNADDTRGVVMRLLPGSTAAIVGANHVVLRKESAAASFAAPVPEPGTASLTKVVLLAVTVATRLRCLVRQRR